MPEYAPDPSSGLPPVWAEDLRPENRRRAQRRKLVVLDDDPTGTQTVSDVPVLTKWTEPLLTRELADPGPCFYILTNSRSLEAGPARVLNREIAANLERAASTTGRSFTLVSRSDSTLRGHYPAEIEALEEIFTPADIVFIAPCFFEAGRITVEDVHYFLDGERWIPVAETAFAADPAFGYRSSNLRDWAREKGVIGTLDSLGLDLIRAQGPDGVARKLATLKPGTVCVVNAVEYADLDVVVAGAAVAEDAGRRLIWRSAASMVAALLGLEKRRLLQRRDLVPARSGPGLIVAGSFVPKTTQQLAALADLPLLERIELSVAALLDPNRGDAEIERVGSLVNQHLAAGRSTLVYTSRELIRPSESRTHLNLGVLISQALVQIVRGVQTPPAYIVAKGGITSSDLATNALNAERALVRGQILPGIPVWELGAETKFPGVPYIVFPGNVGGPGALREILLELGV